MKVDRDDLKRLLAEFLTREDAEASVEYLLFVAGVVVPSGAFFYFMMKALLEWFRNMEAIVAGPFS